MTINKRIEKLDPILKWVIKLSKEKICLPYQPNENGLRCMANELGFPPAATDKLKIMRLHVDEQNCFCSPYTIMTKEGQIKHICFNDMKNVFNFPPSMKNRIEWINRIDFDPRKYEEVWSGQLSVPNAWNDTLRVVQCDVINMYRTTTHVASGDKHPALAVSNHYNYIAMRSSTINGVFYEKYSVASPFTVVTANTIYHPQNNPDGVWMPVLYIDDAWDYVYRLAREQKDMDIINVLPLTLWPVHGTEETWSSLIDPLIWMVIQLHAYSRKTGWCLIQKGQSPKTEFHGAFKAEVAFKDHIQTQTKEEIDMYKDFDLVVCSGQAAGNCFGRTIEQLYNHIMNSSRPKDLEKIIILSDTTSYIAGTEDRMRRSFEKMQKDGLRVMTTEEYTGLLDEMEV